MQMTDLIIKRFYQDLQQDAEHRNSMVADLDLEDLDLDDLDIALEDIDTIDQDPFSLACERALGLGETCSLDNKELAVLLNEMKYAALEQLGDVLDPFAALDEIDRCADVHIEDIDGVRRANNDAAPDEHMSRLIGSIIIWFYRWLDSDDDGSSTEVSAYSLSDFKEACQLTGRMIFACALRNGCAAKVFDEMRCAAIERLPYYTDAIEAIEIINCLEEAC